MLKIKASFATLEPHFYIILAERIKDKSFTKERLKQAINNVIDNCIYPQPTIAQFLGYDKTERVLNYNEACDYFTKGYTPDMFDVIELNGKKYWKLKRK